MTRALAITAVVFAALLGVNWPPLPFNMQISDVVFVLVATLVFLGGEASKPRMVTLDLLVLAYLAGALPSLLITDDLRRSSMECIRHLYLASIYGVVAMLVARGGARPVVFGLAIGGALLASLGVAASLAYQFGVPIPPVIGEVMNMPYVGEVLRLRALTASPGMLGSVLTIAMAFTLAAAIEKDDPQRRRIWLAGSIVVATAMLLTFSHTMSGFLVATSVMVLPLLAARKILRATAAVAVLVAVIGFNLTLAASVRSVSFGDAVFQDTTRYSQTVGDGRVSFGPMHVEYELMGYLRVKEIALEAFLTRPWTGVGLDRFHQVTEAAFQQGRLTHLYRAIDPHSSLFGRLAETGVIGGLTLVALWAGLVFVGARLFGDTTRERWIARAAVAGLAGLVVSGLNVDIMNFRFFWAGAGILRGLAAATEG